MKSRDSSFNAGLLIKAQSLSFAAKRLFTSHVIAELRISQAIRSLRHFAGNLIVCYCYSGERSQQYRELKKREEATSSVSVNYLLLITDYLKWSLINRTIINN